MSNQRFTRWLAVVAALAMAGFASADDRDFLREVAAAPNLIFILDTSSSMVASPEVTSSGDPAVVSPIEGALVASAMVPGGGDDPYSRMGIAKRVLRDFLDDVGEANVALAGYAQAQPSDGSNGVPQKHWVYEARSQDRFHMIEATYAYRMGYSESHTGILLDVPGDILKNRLIGYKPYFSPGGDITDRFGPLNAYDSGYVDYTYQNPIDGQPDIEVLPPFDLMPIYFGNCFIDNRETPSDPSDDETVCADNVFPFYDSGVRDTSSGDLVPSLWYYGQADSAAEDYPGCDPTDPIWDSDSDGNPDPGACQNAWEETSGANLIQYQRRVHLEIPATYGGVPNHFFGVDGSDNPVGNTQTADGGAEDYDLDGFADPDYDGDETNDWMLYVNSVEERSERVCVAGALLPTLTPTLTPTPTPTVTQTPTLTPTPIVDCAKITITSFGRSGTYDWTANISNQLNSEIVIERTEFTWIPYNSSHYVDYFSLNSNSTYYLYLYYPGNSLVTPTEHYTDLGNATYESAADIAAMDTTNAWYVNMSSYVQQPGFHQVCFDFIVYNLPTAGSNWSCPNICAIDYGSANTPTPSPTPTLTPTETPYVPPTWTPSGPVPTATNTPFGYGGSTPTPIPTTGILPTSTPTPWPTATPTSPPPPTPTPPATPTFTPVS